MPQRLTPLEVSLMALDTAHTPGHVGTVHIFDPGPQGFDYEGLIALIRERLAFVPRYRQRVRGIPARLAGPMWVDDENFDLTFHVRRSALPRPGTLIQLQEFVGRVLARGQVHLVGAVVVHHVHDEFAGGLDVAQRVLLGAGPR